ncbi:MAG: low molecular weight phosphotyrosine protein phosphatase [Alphaproteobacteria bacterium]|nr:low molecular weight phosphotyrosine protein phosphatase [Alphaproteobacteria bacterium]
MADPLHLLMVCTGNICRSPMAERLAQDYARRRGRAIEVASGSVMGLDGHPAHKHAVAVLKELGLDLSDHRSQPITRALIDEADYVLVMEYAHAAALRERFPHADERILLLGHFGGRDEIADPLGSWRRRYRISRDEIKRCVEAFIDQLPVAGA